MKKHLSILLLSIITVISAFAVPGLDMPVKKVHGRDYYYHVVKSGETIYGISKRYGLTRDEIVRHNPGVADGLRSESTIYFPVSEYGDHTTPKPDNIAPSAPAGTIAHVVEKGETLFGISHHYGVSPDDIIALNPGSDTGIKSGQTLYIPSGESPQAATDNQDAAPVEDETATAIATGNTEAIYTVRSGDTFFSIARSNGLSFDHLLELNPGVNPDKIHDGMKLRLNDNAPIVFNEPLKELTPPATGITEVEVVTVEDSTEMPAIPEIAVVLPFMLDDGAPTRQTQLYTDFLKGLLIAADTLAGSGEPVNIKVYDTAASTERLADIIASGALDSASVIIAPEDEAQLTMLANYADTHNPHLFNIFNIKSEDHLNHSSVYQANIPHDQMYGKAIEAIMSQFDGYIPVIMSNEGGRNEKSEFTSAVSKAYTDRGVTPVEIVYNGLLRAADLAHLSADSAYVFIPSSGTVTEFNKFARGYKSFKDAAPDPSRIALFGYPDWTAFRNEALETLHSLDAVIYSRFFADPGSMAVRRLSEAFSRWYGKPMIESVPSYAMLGFDTGCYLIRNLRSDDGTFNPDYPSWQGVQSAFNFDNDDDSRINNALYIVRFMPENFVNATVN